MTTTPTATPCRRCGTIGGCLDHKLAKPRRARGLCGACLQWVYAHGQVADYPRTTVLHAPDEARACEWCGGRYTRRHESLQVWEKRRFCSHACWGASLYDRSPVIPTVAIPAAALGWPDQPALTLTTWPLDLLCARLDRPHWETATWNWCPRDPGFAAYHDADTAQRRAA